LQTTGKSLHHPLMPQVISLVSLLVPDYDEAIVYYTGKLGFVLAEDAKLSDSKRWVVVRPQGENGAALLLAKADGPDQTAVIGRQAGGRVFLFLTTDDFTADHARLRAAGIEFLEEPRREPYGVVAVFRDAFGNRWDLIEPCKSPVADPS
jgi:catechol 2,3-dioxygenase-like lactoylglutathione lyase family enzyme